MKYSDEQLKTMLTSYFAKVAELDPWNQPEPGELADTICECHYALIENYSACGRLPASDVLFLLTGAPKNYQAFTIENGELVPLHQEHQPEFCLTCNESKPVVPTEAF